MAARNRERSNRERDPDPSDLSRDHTYSPTHSAIFHPGHVPGPINWRSSDQGRTRDHRNGSAPELHPGYTHNRWKATGSRDRKMIPSTRASENLHIYSHRPPSPDPFLLKAAKDVSWLSSCPRAPPKQPSLTMAKLLSTSTTRANVAVSSVFLESLPRSS